MPPDPAHVTAAHTRLGQLLGETLIHAHPWTAEIDAQTRERFTNAWLEGLEKYSTTLVSDLLDKLVSDGEPPPELAELLEKVRDPSAQFGSLIQQFFIYGLMFQLAGTMLAPFTQQVANNIWSANPDRPVDPSIIATAVGRGLNLGSPPTVNVPQWAYDEAAKQGIPAGDIDLMASIIGLPPALQELFEMYRREIISLDEVKTGLREGDFRDDWIDRAVQLAHAWLTPLDFVRAAVQSQMSYSEAKVWAEKTGLETTTHVPIATGGTEATPDMFGLAFAIAGRPPGPQELGRMANRRIISWSGAGANETTFQQGIAESDIKTKWTDALAKLQVYVPPPRQVGTLLQHGAISAEQAQLYWEYGGVPPELARGYVYMTEQQHIGQDKLLAAGEVKTGYYDGIFDHEQALSLLSDLGYRGAVAEDMLAILDFRREISAINKVVGKVNDLYGAHKLSAAHAQSALETVGISHEQARRLLQIWDVLRIQPVRLPTPAEIGLAYKHSTITEGEAMSELEALGYEARDAAIVLSAHAGAQVKPLPGPGSGVTG